MSHKVQSSPYIIYRVCNVSEQKSQHADIRGWAGHKLCLNIYSYMYCQRRYLDIMVQLYHTQRQVDDVEPDGACNLSPRVCIIQGLAIVSWYSHLRLISISNLFLNFS